MASSSLTEPTSVTITDIFFLGDDIFTIKSADIVAERAEVGQRKKEQRLRSFRWICQGCLLPLGQVHSYQPLV